MPDGTIVDTPEALPAKAFEPIRSRRVMQHLLELRRKTVFLKQS
jgi:hypothetical protein